MLRASNILIDRNVADAAHSTHTRLNNHLKSTLSHPCIDIYFFGARPTKRQRHSLFCFARNYLAFTRSKQKKIQTAIHRSIELLYRLTAAIDR